MKIEKAQHTITWFECSPHGKPSRTRFDAPTKKPIGLLLPTPNLRVLFGGETRQYDFFGNRIQNCFPIVRTRYLFSSAKDKNVFHLSARIEPNYD